MRRLCLPHFFIFWADIWTEKCRSNKRETPLPSHQLDSQFFQLGKVCHINKSTPPDNRPSLIARGFQKKKLWTNLSHLIGKESSGVPPSIRRRKHSGRSHSNHQSVISIHFRSNTQFVYHLTLLLPSSTKSFATARNHHLHLRADQLREIFKCRARAENTALAKRVRWVARKKPSLRDYDKSSNYTRFRLLDGRAVRAQGGEKGGRFLWWHRETSAPPTTTGWCVPLNKLCAVVPWCTFRTCP